MRRFCGSVGRLVIAVGCAVASSGALAQFRVNPYLQQPSSDGILVNWFTTGAAAGQISVTGPGLASPIVASSTATLQANLDYTAANLAQTIPGLAQGSWLVRNPDTTPARNYKHSIPISGLQPGSEYTYTVQQGTETFARSFRTAPTANTWSSIRFIALSDSETEPAGQVTRREWQDGALAAGSAARPSTSASAWATTFGVSGTGVNAVLRYSVTETAGYAENLKVVDARNPDFILMPGDLVQGGGYQPGWDSFFEHNAGFRDDVLSKRAILPALGNWENFAASDGGYAPASVVQSRQRYKSYFDAPSNGTPAHQDNYYRQDYGPITVITLDSSNGTPDDTTQNYATKLNGRQYTVPGTDTQNNFTVQQYQAAYNAAFGTTNHDLSDFNPGSVQWNWAKAQLEDARAKGQVIFVQFHHVPFSDGEHGLPMNHADSTGQGGTPMRAYHPLFEEHSVAAVFSGHSEMFERSFVDEDADGVGVHYYDVGVSGDGLRGERRHPLGSGYTSNNLLNYNPYSQWTADQSEGELWEILGNGVASLVDGGKHYGHLEVELHRVAAGALADLGVAATVTLTPVYVFPLLDANLDYVGSERRVYGDTRTLYLDAAGVVVVPEPGSLGLVALVAGVGIVRGRRRAGALGRIAGSSPTSGLMA